MGELRSKKALFFTYQLKTDRSFKVVIRNLHYSIDIQCIKDELQEKGFAARNVSNIKHWRSKEPLPLFFVELEPTPEAKTIYKLKSLLHTRISVESPRPRREIVQCKRCQQYGHTKTYCTLPSVCVKYGGEHDNRQCSKAPDAAPKCGLCSGNHPANYKGCPEYKKLQKPAKRIVNTRPTASFRPNHTQAQPDSGPFLTKAGIQPHQQNKSYAEATGESTASPQNQSSNNNFDRLVQLMEQLSNQNTQIIGFLTMMVSKLK